MPKITKRFRCVGFLWQERSSIDDIWDCFDFRHREFLGEDLVRELDHAGCSKFGVGRQKGVWMASKYRIKNFIF